MTFMFLILWVGMFGSVKIRLGKVMLAIALLDSDLKKKVA